MKRVILLILFSGLLEGAGKILHISLHQGCIDDIIQVADRFGLSVTSWNLLTSAQDCHLFLGSARENPFAVYNLTHERARQVWDANKEYFDQFDAIITSDTAQLSRVFLQNGWKKPLIIWVCNRFNWCSGPDSENGFDPEFYDLFRAAMKMPHVKVVAYTVFEHYYAALYGVDIRGEIIKPFGARNPLPGTLIPFYVAKPKTVFVYRGRADDSNLDYVLERCSRLGFPTYAGMFNGSYDLKDFKAVIYFPYQASNFIFFENIQHGIVHFVPSERFIKECIKKNEAIYYWHELHMCEWYMGEHRDLIVYFDSWDDLQYKIEHTDYDAMRIKIQAFARYHQEEVLAKWATVFGSLFVLHTQGIPKLRE